MKKMTFFIGLAVCSPIAFGAEITSKIGLKTGYNSNPFRFNDQFTITPANFIKINAKTEFSILKPWSVSAAVKHYEYEDSAKDANQTDIQLASELKFGKTSDHWGASLNFSQRDKTYVSRLKGGLSTYQGEALDERYDFQQSQFELFSKDKFSKKLRNKITLAYQRRDYHDYDSITISDLDYQSFSIIERFDIQPSKQHRNRIDFSFTLRDYVNREQKNAMGSSMADTRLQYHYFNAGYEYRYKSKNAVTTRLAADLENRTDNGEGYYDSNAIAASLGVNYHWSKKHSSTASIKWRDFAYQRDIELTSTGDEEEFNSETRTQLNLNHTISWPALLGKKGELQLSYKFKQADANRTAYQYQQQILQAGIKTRF